MNYTKHYNTLIERARNRDLPKPYERHHVIPKCMGGSNDKSNLVRLTPEEHYVAHQLLVKIHPGNYKLTSAVTMMCRGNNFVIRNNKLFGWIRREHGRLMSIQNKGQIVTEEQRLKRRGRPAWNKGLTLTEEHRKKMSDSHLGIKDTPERKKNKSLAAIKKSANSEYKKSHSERMTLWWTERKKEKND